MEVDQSSSSGQQRLDLQELIERCAQENARYRRGQAVEDIHCLELFRRAMLERDQSAWSAIYAQYGRLVAKWVDGAPDESEERTQEAFLKFYRLADARRWQPGPGELGQLLGLLKQCSQSVRIDAYRREQSHQAALALDEAFESQPDPQAVPVIEQIERRELLQHLEGLARDEQERLVLRLYSFGLTPREMADLAPQQFADVAEVYRVKERVLLRLSSDERLKMWWGK